MSDDQTIPDNLTEELYKQNLELAIKNKTLSLLRELYEVSILPLETKPLAEKISEVIRAGLEFELAGIFLCKKDADDLEPLRFSKSDRLLEVMEKHQLHFADIPIKNISQHPFFNDVVNKRNLTYSDQLHGVWNNFDQAAIDDIQEFSHIKTILGYPLSIRGHVIGVLLVGLNRTYASLSLFEKEAIQNFTNVVAVALDKALIYEELQAANTKLAQVNEGLNVANGRLKELDKQKTEFVSMASHQLRSPLTAIKGYSSMLLEGSFGAVEPKVKSAIEVVFQSSQKLVMVIEDFLNITRIELGTMKYNLSVFDLVDLTQKVVEELKVVVQAKGLELHFNSSTEKCLVNGDSGKIAQVVGNIIDNSAKYTPHGSITVSIDCHDGKARFEVTDTGVGIAPETLPKLFQKFIRADDAGKTNILGTGLGLYVAKQIIEGHQGKIWAESDGVGKGSRFFVELPLAA